MESMLNEVFSPATRWTFLNGMLNKNYCSAGSTSFGEGESLTAKIAAAGVFVYGSTSHCKSHILTLLAG